MAFVTKLLIDGKEIEVLSYQFGFKKNVDKLSKPVSLVSFNGLEIEIESTENTDFEEWMKSEKPKNKIQLQIFYPYLEGGSKIMTFYDCYLVEFQTIFSNNNSQPMKDRLKITSGGVKAPYSEIEYSTSWRKTFSIQDNTTTHVTTIKETKKEKEPKFLGYLFKDEYGKEISQSNLKPDQTVTLIISTENTTGETMNLDLNDNELDYKYNNKIIENDIIKNITITGNETKIKLTTIKEQCNDKKTK